MAKNIDPKLVTIGEYLKVDKYSKFIIPEYQRKYAWDISTCDKLLSDINDFIENENKDPYFFGTIIINCDNYDTEYGLIDGQQRTTTFMLLLKALLTRINETLKIMISDPESESLKRALRERRRKIISILYKVEAEDITDEPNDENDKKIFETFNNLENKSNQETYKEELTQILRSLNFEDADNRRVDIPYKKRENRYTNFFRNFKHFYLKEEFTKIDYLNKFTKTLLEECQVIEIKSWNVEQAITMFNSLNSDGMPLTDSDIIYSKMYASAKGDNERNILGEKWRYLVDITNKLENERIISINSLLNQKMYLYRSINGDTKNASGNIDVTTPGLRRYYRDENPELVKKPIEFCNELIILSEIWNMVKDNTTIQVLFNFNDNSKLFLASFFHRFDSYFLFDENGKISIEDDKKKSMLSEIESIAESMLKLFTILSLVDAGYSSANFKTFLFAEEIKLADNNISIDEIKEDFQNHINKTWGDSKDDLYSRILEYEKNDLVYLNEYLYAKKNKIPFIISSDIDIEHIMPQSGKNLSEIQKDANMNSEEEFYNYINKIGNKILLEYSINRSIGNSWFRTKVSTCIGDKTGYINSCYPLAKFYVEKYRNNPKPYWTKEDIEYVTEIAAKRIRNFLFDEQ